MLEDLENRNFLSKKEVVEAEESIVEQESEFREAFAHSYNVVFGTVETLENPVVAFSKLHSGVNFDAPDGSYTIFFFLILTSSRQIMDFRFSLGHVISKLMSDEDFHTAAWIAHTRKELATAYERYTKDCKEKAPVVAIRMISHSNSSYTIPFHPTPSHSIPLHPIPLLHPLTD
jgi:hypothetical protein